MQNLEKVQQCSFAIKKVLAQGFSPKVGIVLGTGLGGLADCVKQVASVPYQALPDFPLSTVHSHEGKFIFGYIADVPVVLQQGRCHLYEGYSPEEVVMGTRVMACLGISSLILTNAAGALNPHFQTGEIMLVTDHINFTGKSPLTGKNCEEWGVRFPDMSKVYDAGYQALAKSVALSEGLQLFMGVYAGINGPQLETPAETRMYRTLGADAIGMSTVMEAIAAKHLGLRTLGLSCLTNKNLPDCMAEASLEDIVNSASESGVKLARLIKSILPSMNAGLYLN